MPGLRLSIFCIQNPSTHCPCRWRALTGPAICGARRRGKLVLLDLEPAKPGSDFGDPLVIHLRMTGSLPPGNTRLLRASIPAVFYALGDNPGNYQDLFFDDIRHIRQNPAGQQINS